MQSVWDLRFLRLGYTYCCQQLPKFAPRLTSLRSHRRRALHGEPQIDQSLSPKIDQTAVHNLPYELGDVYLLIALRDVPACNSAPAA